MIKQHIVPTTFNFVDIFEKISLKKFPEFQEIVDTVDIKETNQEFLAFKYFKNVLTNYDLNTILFFDQVAFRVDHGNNTSNINYRFTKSDGKNNSEDQTKALEFLTQAIIAGAYLSKTPKDEIFKEIPQHLKDEIGYTDLESDRINLRRTFWETPFLITKTPKTEF